MKAFGFYYQCDEGFDGYSAIFHTDDVLKASQYIINQIRLYLERKDIDHGKYFYNMITSADSTVFLGPEYMYIDDTIERESFKVYFRNITPEKFLQHIEQTYVDGDSYFQIVLSEITSRNIIYL